MTLRLSCTGLLRYKMFVKAYVAALYGGDGVAAADVLADVPKRLELSYFWSISAADLRKAGDQILRRNVDERTFAALQPRLERRNGWYRDVKPGDRYSPSTRVHAISSSTAVGRPPGSDLPARRLVPVAVPVEPRSRRVVVASTGPESRRGTRGVPRGVPPR